MSNERTYDDELNRFWNDLVRGRPASGEYQLAADEMETLRRVHVRSSTPLPSAAREQAWWDVYARIQAVSTQPSNVRSTVESNSLDLHHPTHGPNGRVEPSSGPWTRVWFPTERRRWLAAQLATAALLVVTLLGLYVVYESRNQPAVSPPATSTGNVYFDRGNLARTGEMPGPGPKGKPSLLWSFDAYGMSSAINGNLHMLSPATVVDGIVYTTSENYLFALDATTGAKRWEFPTPSMPDIWSAPSVAEGLVYFASTDGKVFAVDALTGEQRWVASLNAVDLSPLVVDGVVYVITNDCDNTDQSLVALDADTGKHLKWTPIENACYWSSLTYDAGVIYAASQVSESEISLFAIDVATGEQRWRRTFDHPSRFSPAGLSVADGLVFFGTMCSFCDPPLYALDAATGQERWRTSSRGPGTFFLNGFPIAHGVLFGVNNRTGTRFAIDVQSGAKLWETTASENRASVVAGSVLYETSRDGSLLALDTADGRELWRVEMYGARTEDRSYPTISEGVIYISLSGRLYAYGDASEAPPATLETDVFADRGNVARNGQMPGPGPEVTPALLWSFPGESVGNNTFSPAAVVDGIVYTRTSDRLFALDAKTGVKQWEVRINGHFANLPAPSVIGGLVFAGTYDGKLHAFDAKTGEQRWIAPVSTNTFSPLVVDGVVYVVAPIGDSSILSLVALDAETGEQLRIVTTRPNPGYQLAYDDGVIYAVSGKNLFAIDPSTGADRWKFALRGPAMLGPAIAEGVVVVGVNRSTTPNLSMKYELYAIDVASGTERWHLTDVPFPGFAGFAISNGVVYGANPTSNTTYAYDALSGEKRWEVRTGDFSMGPVVVGSVLYGVTLDGTLLALDALDGQELWQLELDEERDFSWAYPTVSDGVMYVGSNGMFYAFGDPPEPSM